MLGITAEYYRKGWNGEPLPRGLKSQPILYKAFMKGREDSKKGINIFKDGVDPQKNSYERRFGKKPTQKA